MESGNKYLLLVDKHGNTCDQLRNSLAQRGYSVVLVADDEVAVKYARRIKFIAVVLNSDSSEDEHLLLVRQLLAVDASLPCIVLSHAAEAIAVEALSEALKKLTVIERAFTPNRMRERRMHCCERLASTQTNTFCRKIPLFKPGPLPVLKTNADGRQAWGDKFEVQCIFEP